MLKQNFRFDQKMSQLGYSMVELVLAIGILGAMTGLIMKSSQMAMTMKVKQNDKYKFWSYRSGLLSVTKEVLLSVEDSSTGRRTRGICGNFRAIPQKPGISTVEMNLELAPVLTSSRWGQFLSSDWKLASCAKPAPKSETHFQYRQCFDFVGPKKKVKKAQLTISVINLDIQTGVFDTVIREQTPTWSDVKRVAISVESIVTKNNDKTITDKELFMGADVGYCHIAGTAKGSESYSYQVYPSGSAIGGGIGTSSIYNNSSFIAPSERVLAMRLGKSAGVQVGTLQGQYISADPSFNVALSCNEKKFRCPKQSGVSREFENPIRIELTVDYSPGMNLPQATPAKVDIWFNDVDSGALYHPQKVINAGTNEEFSPFSITGGSQVAILNFEDRSSGPLCRAVCTPKPNNTKPRVRLASTIELVDSAGRSIYAPQSFVSSDELSCTVCYMKSCRRLGLGTFGPYWPSPASDRGQPDEPLDGTVPECAMKDHAFELKSMSPYVQSVGTDHSCISGFFDIDGSLKLESKNCSDVLPVMCFAFGGFRLAKEVASGVTAKATHRNAAKTCFSQGQEIVDKSKMRALFSSFNKTFNPSLMSPGPTSEALIFHNVARQGIFLAPQIPSQIQQMKVDLETGFDQKRFWLNLQSDKGGRVIGHVPMVANLNIIDPKQSALYFDDDGSPKQRGASVNSVSSLGLDISSSQEGTYNVRVGMLVHNIRDKGVIAVRKKQVQAQKFLCMKHNSSHDMFLSSGRSTKFENGHDRCASDGGGFYPPITPLQWAQALQVLSPNHPSQAFPSTSGVEAVWVGIEFLNDRNSSATGSYKIHKELKGQFPFETLNRVLAPFQAPNTTNKHIILVDSLRTVSELAEKSKSVWDLKKELHCARKNYDNTYVAPPELVGIGC